MKTIAADKLWKEQAAARTAATQGSRPNVRGGCPRHAAPLLRAERHRHDTQASLWCVLIHARRTEIQEEQWVCHARHVDRNRTRIASPTAGVEEHTQPQDPLRRRRISFHPTTTLKKARTEVHVHQTSPAKLENPDATTQFFAAEAPSRASSLFFDAVRRERTNLSSACGTSCPQKHVSKTEE